MILLLTLLLATHRYSGTMFLTGRLGENLSTLYALIIILINLAVFCYIFKEVLREVFESLPLLQAFTNPSFWLNIVWPTAVAHAKFMVLGSRHKHEYLTWRQKLHEFLRPYREVHIRQQLVRRIDVRLILALSLTKC